MSAQLHKTRVDLAGLMRVLGEHLYSTPTVALRELVQNAHDSCERRRIEDPSAAASASRIVVVANPAERTLAIEGFTDSVGDDSYNQTLSERRAATVRLALMNEGVASDRIISRGYGEAFPVASNDTPEGRQRNR